MIERITILGGDRRQYYLAKQLRDCGFQVKTFGVVNCDDSDPALPDALRFAQAVILPMPAFSADGSIRNAVSARISPAEVIACSPAGAVLFGGNLAAGQAALRSHFRQVYDFSDSEALAIANAVPTAEGAIQLAMEQMPVTLSASACLVIGYGRIGRVLARMLHSLGAKVTVCSRKLSDAAWIRSEGLLTDLTGQYLRGLRNYDCIFNTVPAPILKDEQLRAVRSDCVILDLASGRGGLSPELDPADFPNYTQALALPGKVAPATAAELLKNEILDALTA